MKYPTIKEIVKDLNSTQYLELNNPPLFDMKKLNKGSFSNVYMHELNKKIVIKIMRTEWNEGTIEYMNYCKNHENNIYLPRVYAIHEKGDFTAVVMEKLKTNVNSAAHFIDKNFNLGNNWKTIKVLTDTDKQIKSIVTTLRKIVKEYKYKFDFHEQNIMFRTANRVNQPVIVDPIYNPYKISEARAEINSIKF